MVCSRSYVSPVTAKGHLGLWWELFERYTKPGQWVLDPMAGIGSSMIGAMMGRNVICNERESHFVEPMRASWTKMRQQAMLGCELGQVVIIQGDARCLPLGRADAAIFSPPWEDKVAMQDNAWLLEHTNDPEMKFRQKTRHYHEKLQEGYTRPVDVVVTSPPYEGIVNSGEGPGASGPASGMWQGPNGYSSSNPSYTRPAAVITSPPWEDNLPNHLGGETDFTQVGGIRHKERGYTRPAAVITSPPYEGTIIGREESLGEAPFGGPNSQARGVRYAPGSTSNIGNLRGNAYWEAMRLVYAECHRVLALGSVMALVVKGYTRDGQYVDLPQQTVDECEKLGFKLQERWDRELWGLSFWRILQGTTKQTRQVALQMGLTDESTIEIIESKRVNNGKVDERLRFETVLALKKA